MLSPEYSWNIAYVTHPKQFIEKTGIKEAWAIQLNYCPF
jgi:hypothetical protein